MAANPFLNPPGGTTGTSGFQSSPTGAPANPFAPTTSGFSGTAGSSTSGLSSNTSNPFGSAPTTTGFSNPFAANGSDTENQFSTPGSATLNLGQIPGAQTQTYQISPQVQAMLNGQGGFTPQTMASMNATATESAANAGQQQMAQVKRAEAQSGVANSPGAAGYAGAVAKQTGQQQQANLAGVQQQNAQLAASEQQQAAQLQQQAGEGNMQAANQLALQNAQMLYNAMLANQQARTATQFNIYGGG